jgi:hypothetical protein
VFVGDCEPAALPQFVAYGDERQPPRSADLLPFRDDPAASLGIAADHQRAPMERPPACKHASHPLAGRRRQAGTRVAVWSELVLRWGVQEVRHVPHGRKLIGNRSIEQARERLHRMWLDPSRPDAGSLVRHDAIIGA